MFEGTSCINDPIIISSDLAFRAEATTGEGSIWHPDRNTLFWVDIEGKTLYEYIPDLQNCRSWQFDHAFYNASKLGQYGSLQLYHKTRSYV